MPELVQKPLITGLGKAMAYYTKISIIPCHSKVGECRLYYGGTGRSILHPRISRKPFMTGLGKGEFPTNSGIITILHIPLNFGITESLPLLERSQ